MYNPKTGAKEKLGQTEVINDNLNPEFIEAVEVDFYFEESHKFEIEVYDADSVNSMGTVKKKEFVGSHSMTLHQVVTKKN